MSFCHFYSYGLNDPTYILKQGITHKDQCLGYVGCVRLAVVGVDLLWKNNTADLLVADLVWDNSTAGWLADKPSKHSDSNS